MVDGRVIIGLQYGVMSTRVPPGLSGVGMATYLDAALEEVCVTEESCCVWRMATTPAWAGLE